MVIDADPLGLITHPSGSEEAGACRNWLLDVALDGSTVVVAPLSEVQVPVSRYFLPADKTPMPASERLATKPPTHRSSPLHLESAGPSNPHFPRHRRTGRWSSCGTVERPETRNGVTSQVLAPESTPIRCRAVQW